jgi:precorrin isomerase
MVDKIKGRIAQILILGTVMDEFQKIDAYASIKVATTSPISDDTKASSSRNDLLLDTTEYTAKITAKIIGSTTWVKYMDAIRVANNGMNRDLGMLQTLSKKNAQINMIKATVEGANQRKGWRGYPEPLNALAETKSSMRSSTS